MRKDAIEVLLFCMKLQNVLKSTVTCGGYSLVLGFPGLRTRSVETTAS